MALPLRVLILADRPDDAELMLAEMRRAGFDPSWRVADCERDFLANLEPTPDVILADHTLPDFDPPSALDILRARGLDIPFVVVTEAISDESAVECVKQGAADYLLKDRLARLGRAIDRAIREKEARAKARRQSAALRESEERYRTLVEAIDDGVVVKDRNHRYVTVNSEAARRIGRPREEIIGRTALDVYDRTEAEFVMAGDQQVLETCAPVDVTQEDPSWGRGRVFHLHLVPLRSDAGDVTGVVTVSRDITARRRAQQELSQSYGMLRKVMEGAVHAMAAATEMRDPYTAGHQRKVSELASAIAQEMGMPSEEVEGVRLAGIIHDLGKLSVPAEILSKPGRMTDAELSIIKNHPRSGREILSKVEFLWPIARMVGEHHERLNGLGYPDGLVGDGICLGAKILAVADVVEAMSSHRPYRPALGIDKALEEISSQKGLLYDPGAVDVCVRLFREGGFDLEAASVSSLLAPASAGWGQVNRSRK